MKPIAQSAPSVLVVAVSAMFILWAPQAGAADAEAAKALARMNKCLNCHAVEKEKEGPSYKEVAKRYQGKPKSEAHASILKHISSGKKVKFPDGHEEDHKIVKTLPEGDQAQITNLIDWILAQ